MADDDDIWRDKRGHFQKGNKFWRMSPPETRMCFSSPDAMRKACFEYFEWVDDNPLWEVRALPSGALINLPKARAMSIRAMCVFLGMTQRSWQNYRDREAYADTVELIESIIYEQKFSGAAAGFFHAAIIARDLGLADKSEVENKLVVEVIDNMDEDDAGS